MTTIIHAIIEGAVDGARTWLLEHTPDMDSPGFIPTRDPDLWLLRHGWRDLDRVTLLEHDGTSWRVSLGGEWEHRVEPPAMSWPYHHMGTTRTPCK